MWKTVIYYKESEPFSPLLHCMVDPPCCAIREKLHFPDCNVSSAAFLFITKPHALFSWSMLVKQHHLDYLKFLAEEFSLNVNHILFTETDN